MLTPTITFAGNSLSLGYRRAHHKFARRTTKPVIKGLSRRSRNYLMREINRMASSPTRYVVLNFPPDVPVDPVFVKRCVKLLGQRLVRRFPDHSTLWRLEFTAKGVPHIHLAGDFGFISEGLLTEWLFKLWRVLLGFSATEPENIVHVRVPVDTDTPRHVRYFCKRKKSDIIGSRIYCKEYGETSRCCGHFNGKMANLAPVIQRPLTVIQRKKIEALLVEHLAERLEEINPGKDVQFRQAFIDKIANGNDTCLHFLPDWIMDKVRGILGSAA